MLQKGETFNPGQHYWVDLNTVVVAGNDPVDSQTAWIYNQWLGGYDFGIADANQRANAVQNAIWCIEGEISN